MLKVIQTTLLFSLMKKITLFLVVISLSVYALNAQILHDNSCSSISTSFTLDWEDNPGANQFNWTPQGNTSFTASNIQGTGNQIAFAVTGATGTLTTENSISTPGVTNSLSGGVDALHISSSGLSASQEIRLTMTFTPALAGDISFDLYNLIELSGGGIGGQQMEVFGLTSTGFAIVPELTDNGSPSWELEGPGVIDGNATSTAGTNDQVGVNFRSISDISTITVILRRCSGCGNATNTEFALGDIDICLTPDTDQDGIPDTQDQDDDNDGILDVIEKCPTQDRSLADWDNYTYNNGDASNTYNLPDGTNMTVAVSSNGASIVAGETNSDLTGGQGAGTVGLFLNGNQNLQVNSIDVTFSFDQAIDSLEYTIFDVDQLGGQYVDSITVIGYFDGFVVFPNLTSSANNTVTQNRAVGDVSTADNLATANLDVAFTEPIDSMVVYYGNGSTAPAAPGNQWITIWDFSYIGDCGSVDSDGDGVADYLDIDADNDGIVDYIEWQASTATPIAPAGADADSDGIDDNFEVVSAPVDTDGDGIPDFQDPDADNDGDLDILEGWDTNNDGVADTSPSGIDTDGDGFPDWQEGFDDDEDGDAQNDLEDRADAFETAAGNPLFYINTDDADNDGLPDWLEDDDADNVPNFLDPDNAFYQDTDGDGTVDLYDTDNSGTVASTPDTDGDGEYDFRDTDNQTSLPVELIGFTALAEGDRSKLIWATESELNNDYFLIERAGEDGDFKVIAQVDGAGNSNRRLDYFTYDENPLEGNNYYRLKQVDFNGEYSYSQIEVLQYKSEMMDASLYPNPTNGEQLFLTITEPKAGKYTLRVLSSEGKVMLVRELSLEAETLYFELELLNRLKLSSGTYFVVIQSVERLKTLPFIVR